MWRKRWTERGSRYVQQMLLEKRPSMAEYRSGARRDMESAVLGRGSEPVRFCFPGEPMSGAAVRAAGASALHASKPAGSARREASMGGQDGKRRGSMEGEGEGQHRGAGAMGSV